MSSKEKCISCGKRPIDIKKWRRCTLCYQIYRRTPGFADNRTHPKHHSEMEFVKNFFAHQNWIYQPGMFRFNGGSYQPDFYDGERNIFIEVAGTRQAFYTNLEKYREFVKTFPKINFEIRQVNGDLIDLSAEKYSIDDNSQK